jgi:hypothetical protein
MFGIQLVAKAAVHAPAVNVISGPIVGADMAEPAGVRQDADDAKAELAIVPDVGGGEIPAKGTGNNNAVIMTNKDWA